MGGRALVIVVIAACGSPSVSAIDAPGTTGSGDAGVDPNEGAHSGTRLKLTWFDFTDGTRQWDSFYDAQRKESCYPYPPWLDGKTYCTPDDNASVVYTDAGCTQKIGQVYRDPSCPQPPPAYLLEWHYDACTSGPAHLYRRGAKTAVAQYYSHNYDGSCAGPYTSSSYDFYALGAEITADRLVEITYTPGTAVGRLAPVYYASADGMRLPTRLRDTQLATDCYPETFADGATQGACIPIGAAYAGNFDDASCTQPAIGVPSTCAAPPYAQYRPTNACPSDPPHVASLTGAAASQLFYWSGSSCVAQTLPPGSTYYGAGADVSIAPVTRTIDALASHRIQLAHYTTPDGLRYRDYTVYDSLEGADCYPTDLPDGTTVCLPYGGYVETFYRDAACTQTVDLIEVSTGAGGCAVPAAPKYARKYITPQPGSCQYNIELHQVATPYAGTVYTNYGTCAAYTPIGTRFYSIAAASSLNEFVSATKSVDP